MATFTSFQDTLPDPNNRISRSGGSVNPVGTTAINSRLGPGFTSVNFTAKQPVMMNRTNSGRVITRSVAAHSWDIDISYNNLTREEFEPVFAFLMAKNGRLNPFFINLPQYLTSRDADFAGQAAIGNDLVVNESGGIPAGRTYMKARKAAGAGSFPAVGDMFTITDGSNSNHTKAYMVTRLESTADYNTSFDASTNPGGTGPFDVRLHFSPPLVAATSNSSVLDFTAPKIRVIQASDVTQYSLGTNGLYKFGLKVEEALP